MLRSEVQQVAEAREEFLAVVSQRIAGKLSALDAYESVQEMRAHIDATAAAYQEVGYEPAEAMRLALSKFGDARQLGSALAKTAEPVVQQDSQNGLHVRVRLADLANIGAVSLAGALAMVVADVFFQQLGMGTYVLVGIDLAFGGFFGLLIGMYATFAKGSPTVTGMHSAVAISMLLLVTETRGYVERPLQLVCLVAILGGIAFMLGFYGRRLHARLRRLMEADVIISSRPGMT